MLKKMILAFSLLVIFSGVSDVEAGKGEKEKKQEGENSKSNLNPQKLKKSHSQKDNKKEKKKELPKSQSKASARKLKKTPSQEHQEIMAIYDETHYLDEHMEKIKKSGLTPFDYFIKHGLKKGHQAAAWLQPEVFQKIFALEEDPLLHLASLKKGVTRKKINDEEVIVSITSHPPRIETTWLSILSLLKQDVKPNRIILYLAKSDFPEKELPKSLMYLQRKGLEVRFSETNYRVATKLLPALQEFPDAVILTADDDRIYPQGWLGALLSQHRQYPLDIISPSARKYVFYEGSSYGAPKMPVYPHIDYLYQSRLYDTAAFGIFEGFSGVLYPPHALNPEVMNFNNFRALTPYADDVWFQAMAILNGTKVRGLPQSLQEKYAWPPEIEGTQESGLFHKHLRANDWMAYRTLYYYGLLGKSGGGEISDPKCQGCKRNIKVHKYPEKLKPHKLGAGKIECRTCLNTHRRKVLCIGAYDYGNIGDKLYKIILKKTLGDFFKMYFVPDNVYLDRKGKYIHVKPQGDVLNFDAVIVGGGGILKDFPITGSIHYYANLAIDKQKPLFFVSTGLQTHKNNPTIEDTKKILGDSANLMRKASLIFVRSVRDQFLVGSVLGESASHKLAVVPDLGYLYPEIMGITPSQKKYITLIQTGSASVQSEYVRQIIALEFKKNPSAELVVMNWGGSKDATQKEDFDEYGLFARKTKEYYPNATVYMGDAISRSLKKLRYSKIPTRASDLTPETAVKIVAQSHVVISGRYHGLVIAKALGIPCITPISTHKVLAEKESPLDITQAGSPLVRIKEYINRNSDSLLSPRLWGEDGNDRNSSIVKVHETFGLPISHVQSMDDTSIWKLLAYGISEF